MKIAEIAYNAYVKQAGGRSLVSGEELPPYDRLPVEIQRAWEAAARAVQNVAEEK